MTKRNILCLLLAAALLVQPISLRSWAEEVTEETQQEEQTAPVEEPTEATEETEETEPTEEATEPEEVIPEETEKESFEEVE